MKKQKFFNFDSYNNMDINNFFVNDTNIHSFETLTKNTLNKNILLVGPKKSGKTHLANIWMKKNDSVFFNKNFKEIISIKKNIIFDTDLTTSSEEDLFHIINHCFLNSLKILVITSFDLFEYNFKLPDLKSRLKSFFYTRIKLPDDEMLLNILTKKLTEKQFIINNKDIFDYLLNHVTRSYEEINNVIDKIDNLSLEKKRQLTIPLIKEIL
ncbi:MAG: hypothetical protein CMI96_01370 [Pelagibacteraceae bacterium]|nr:hypothetical protein [Pelagibacteraceae bacterium]|tara:strand:- start:2803 stop:3435 length:633 start_codon:yes stop_codon:yes gene_type:complete